MATASPSATEVRSPVPVEVLAAVVHFYRDGIYSSTYEGVFQPDSVERFCETYNEISGGELLAVAEYVPVTTIAPPVLVD